MTTPHAITDDHPTARAGSWGAVYALTLCVSTLVAAEFMPVSLLTPIATGLHLTEGQAGQAISVSGIFAVLTSLSISSVRQRIDRRTLLLGLTALMLASGLVTAFAPNFVVLLAGRALVGMVIGGFWSMSAATVMRLVPEKDVPRALAVLNGGNALVTTVAAPLGALLGEHVGWRGAFFCVVPLAAITYVWQFATLPKKMPGQARPRAAGPFALLRRPPVAYGIGAVALFFAGQFAPFTYVRPFLEAVTGVHGAILSRILLAMGLAGLLGTWLIGFAVDARLRATLVVLPVAMGALALGLIALGSLPVATTVLLAFWGLIGTAAPVAWWTWLSRTAADDAEAGGGLMVAVIQLATTAGAAGGGTLFDASGYRTTFAASAILFCASAVVAYFGSRAASAAARKGRCAPDASVESRRGDAGPKRVAERDRVAA